MMDWSDPGKTLETGNLIPLSLLGGIFCRAAEATGNALAVAVQQNKITASKKI